MPDDERDMMGEWKGNIGMEGSGLFKAVSVEDVLLLDIL